MNYHNVTQAMNSEREKCQQRCEVSIYYGGEKIQSVIISAHNALFIHVKILENMFLNEL